ncbi:hypothetical protein D918_07362 [Trichuris suis]|nr:hypothetical protein D918_07362 [Trichuris suis]
MSIRDVNYAAAPLRTLKCRERGKENAPIRLSDEAIGRRRDIWKATMALCRMSRDDLALFLSGSDEFLLSEREALPKWGNFFAMRCACSFCPHPAPPTRRLCASRARFNYINGPVFFLNMVSFEFTYETDRAQPRFLSIEPLAVRANVGVRLSSSFQNCFREQLYEMLQTGAWRVQSQFRLSPRMLRFFQSESGSAETDKKHSLWWGRINWLEYRVS